jgi:protein-S-isoprenylcysteine O-methyltransferase Ste14
MSPQDSDAAKVIAPPPFLFFACFGAGFSLSLIFPLHIIPGAETIRWVVALVLACASGLIAVWAWRLFRKHKTPVDPGKATSQIIQEGPFGFTRNPLYLALVLLMAAAFFYTASLWLLAFGVILFFLLDVGVIRREEVYLGAKFGDEFEAYCRQVRRWL